MPTTLDDLRQEHGEFTFPVRDEYATAIPSLDHQIGDVMEAYVDLWGWKNHATRAARLDIASKALSEGDGYQRKVTSFNDLTRAELIYIMHWLEQTDLVAELKTQGWLPQPKPERILRLLVEDDQRLGPRTKAKLTEKYLHGN